VDNAFVKLPVEVALRFGRPEKMLRALLPSTLGEKARAMRNRAVILNSSVLSLFFWAGNIIGPYTWGNTRPALIIQVMSHCGAINGFEMLLHR